jgi:Flp pilus assembly protein TadD
VWQARALLRAGAAAGAEARLVDFEHEQADTNAAGFRATGLALRGAALLAQAKLDSAATALQAAIALDADDPNAHRLLAAVHDRRGDRLSAIRELQRHLALVPADDEARRELERLAGGAR